MTSVRMRTGLVAVFLCLMANVAAAQLPGDFNGNGELDAGDIDMFCSPIPLPLPLGELDHDLNDDGFVNEEDHRIWVKELKLTWYGDANLDLEFNESDMVQVFVQGKYEKGVNAAWGDGDWDCSMRFDSSDMVKAFADGGYEQGPRTDAAAVPEPAGWLLLVIGVAGLLTTRRNCC